jgi:UDP-GlcNAc:undecaprenyl-phosphate GlcNAc-1-phosphate transferase
MNLESSARFLCVAAAAAVATALLARLAPKLGWTDAPEGAEAARKLQRCAVPCVGGAALLLALGCAGAEFLAPPPAELWGPWLPAAGWRLATLVGVFAVGAWDDRAGLAPGPKALAQLAALTPLVFGVARERGLGAGLVLLLGGVAALNLLNTFDNADGALTSLCALGFALTAPLVSAACLGFLPFNMDAARHGEGRAPSAYLGDSGAFVLAGLVLLEPLACGVLVLPALDLARLSVLRLRAGSRPWLGDRRHLAHRLAARGLSPAAVAVLQCLIAAPACVFGARALQHAEPWSALAGFGATLGAFVLALRAAPESSEVV